MDIATIVGVVSGIGLVVVSILMNSGLDLFWSAPSLAIVGGGTIAATLIAYPLKEVLGVMKLVQRIFLFRSTKPSALIKELLDIAIVARKSGILSMEKEIDKIKNEFLKKGLQMVVDGMDEKSISQLMQIEVTHTLKRHRAGWEIFAEMGKYSPAFGMVGTLIGLIQMLANLNDPSSIGPKMAIALITTFYGSLFANLIFVPMSVKLKNRSQEESLIMSLVIEATRSIRNGESPKLMEERLNKFFSENEKKKADKSSPKKGKIK